MAKARLTASLAWLLPLVASCSAADGELTVGAIQGTGAESPMQGQVVEIEGIVAGDFQDDGNALADLGGFYLAGKADSDARTSDGIFVFDGGRVDVSVGDRVVVRGEVSEFFGETQIKSASVSVTGRGSVQPVNLSLPVATTVNEDGELIADLEAFEGMLVRIDDALTVIDTYNLDRYGEIVLAAGGRQFTFTEVNDPDAQAFSRYLAAAASRRLILDDGQRSESPRPLRYVNGSHAPRVGDRVAGLTGVIRYSRGSGGRGQQNYRLEPVAEPGFDAGNPRLGPPAVGGALQVAALNALNLFSSVDNGEARCGPRRNENCRGADSRRELTRQVDKLVATISGLDADIVGLLELENNRRASLELIVDALAEAGEDYNYVDSGIIGDDVIKVGLLYRPGEVSLRGDFAVIDDEIDPDFVAAKNRPVLAQAFEHTATGETLTVAVAHLKSKGSDCDALNDPDRGDGQGNCNATRTSAARVIAEWLADDPLDSGGAGLLLGDLNAYRQEDPIRALQAGGLEYLEAAAAGETYSFVRRGFSGALDHALATPALSRQVADVAKWHINADEARLGDYNTEGRRDDDWFEGGTPCRSSDHDPIVVGLYPARAATVDESRLTITSRRMGALQRDRSIRVYLPPDYDDNAERSYPVLYLHDGQNVFDERTSYAGEWRVDETLDALYAESGLALIAVAVDHGNQLRLQEMAPWPHADHGPAEADDYLDFIVNELKPWIDERYRTLPSADNTAMAGASMGGLVTHYAALRHADVFSRFLILSPSYWWSRSVFTQTDRQLPSGRLFIAVGGEEGETMTEPAAEMFTLLEDLPAGNVRSSIVAGMQHNERFWQTMFPEGVSWLFRDDNEF